MDIFSSHLLGAQSVASPAVETDESLVHSSAEASARAGSTSFCPGYELLFAYEEGGNIDDLQLESCSEPYFCVCPSQYLEGTAGFWNHGAEAEDKILSVECWLVTGGDRIVLAAGECSGLLNGISGMSQATKDETRLLVGLSVSSGRAYLGTLCVASASTLADVAPKRDEAKKRQSPPLYASLQDGLYAMFSPTLFGTFKGTWEMAGN